MVSRNTTMSHTAAKTRWVVWHPEQAGSESSAPEWSSRGWCGRPIADLHDAFAEVCLIEKSQRSRVAWGLSSQERAALLLSTEPTPETLDELRHAMIRYAPDASLWRLDHGRLTQAFGVDDSTEPPAEQLPPDDPAQPTHHHSRSLPRPRPRFERGGGFDRLRFQPPIEDIVPDERLVPEVAITQDEMAMLLSSESDGADSP